MKRSERTEGTQSGLGSDWWVTNQERVASWKMRGKFIVSLTGRKEDTLVAGHFHFWIVKGEEVDLTAMMVVARRNNTLNLPPSGDCLFLQSCWCRLMVLNQCNTSKSPGELLINTNTILLLEVLIQEVQHKAGRGIQHVLWVWTSCWTDPRLWLYMRP